MTALDNLPSQKQFLNTTGFKLIMKRAPNIQFFVQRITMPGISTDTPEQATPFLPIPFPGEQMHFEPLRMSFKVAEDMADYMEIFNWLHGTSTAGTTTYLPLQQKLLHTGAGVKSDIVLMVLTSAKNPAFEVVFHDCFPVSLGAIDFSSTEDSTDYPVVDVEFRYTNFEVIVVS